MSTRSSKIEYMKCSNVLGPDETWDLVDGTRQDVLARTCKPKALELYLFLLKNATIEALPGQGLTAVFSCHCLRNLASAYGGSYDFISRTIAIMGALELVQHYHHTPSGTQIHLHLGPYQAPASLNKLNNLRTNKRFKLCQLANSTRKRYIYHYGDPGRATPASTMQQLKETCQQLLQGPMNRETITLLTDQVHTLASYVQQGDSPRQKGYSIPQTSKVCAYKGETGNAERETSIAKGDLDIQKGDSHRQKGYLAPEEDIPKGDSLAQKGYLAPEENTQKGDLPAQEGYFGAQKGRPVVEKGYLEEAFCAEKGYSPDSFEHKQGDSEAKRETQVTPVSIIDHNNLLSALLFAWLLYIKRLQPLLCVFANYVD
ncbi:hypothetical protein KDA_70160 [Dictyobacter alpinus]|uniref:Uncharacterized protein n=1 Tax=Dictyobacter alpinus TaxID=2014873 RepID=A0A402BJK8_9CHLR|nr:hypothetical protein [Dictyobacter alpinus]GCE31532.1 hypothetical protein KDA_70160 [Dictyobacter alpinus]